MTVSSSIAMSVPTLVAKVFGMVFHIGHMRASASLKDASRYTKAGEASSGMDPFFPGLSSLVFASVFCCYGDRSRDANAGCARLVCLFWFGWWLVTA